MSSDESSRQVVIYHAASPQQAQLLRNLLEDEGIQAVVVNDTLQAVTGEVPFGWTTLARVVVAQADADRARRITADFDVKAAPLLDETHPGRDIPLTDGPLAEWPVCPACNRRRTAVCPVCGTAGSDFALGWGETTAGTVELNVATERRATAEDEAADLLVICSGCDESFRPGFLARCEWCGHRFRSGVAAGDVEEDRGSPELPTARVVAAVVVIVIVVAAMFVYFASIVP